MAQDLGDIVGSVLGGRGNRVLGTILNGTSNVRPSTLLNEEYARQQQDPNDSLTKKEADAILDRAQKLRYPLTITNGKEDGTFVFSYPGVGASPPLRLPMDTVEYVQSRRVNWQADVTNHPEVAAARAPKASAAPATASPAEPQREPTAEKLNDSPAIYARQTEAAAKVAPITTAPIASSAPAPSLSTPPKSAPSERISYEDALKEASALNQPLTPSALLSLTRLAEENGIQLQFEKISEGVYRFDQRDSNAPGTPLRFDTASSQSLDKLINRQQLLATPTPALSVDTAALTGDDRVTGGQPVAAPAPQMAGASVTIGNSTNAPTVKEPAVVYIARDQSASIAMGQRITGAEAGSDFAKAIERVVLGRENGTGVLSDKDKTAAMNLMQNPIKFAALDSALTQAASAAPAMVQASAADVKPDAASITPPTTNGLLPTGMMEYAGAKGPTASASAAPAAETTATVPSNAETVRAAIDKELAQGLTTGKEAAIETLLHAHSGAEAPLTDKNGSLTPNEQANFNLVVNTLLKTPEGLAEMQQLVKDLGGAGVAGIEQVNAGDPPKGNTVASGMGVSKDTAALLG